MPRNSGDFAPPPREEPAVAIAPTAGKGFSIDAGGHHPISVESGRARIEYVTVTLDPANLAAHTGQTHTLTIPGLKVDDLCFWIGIDNVTDSTGQVWLTRPPICSTEDQIVLAQ